MLRGIRTDGSRYRWSPPAQLLIPSWWGRGPRAGRPYPPRFISLGALLANTFYCDAGRGCPARTGGAKDRAPPMCPHHSIRSGPAIIVSWGEGALGRSTGRKQKWTVTGPHGAGTWGLQDAAPWRGRCRRKRKWYRLEWRAGFQWCSGSVGTTFREEGGRRQGSTGERRGVVSVTEAAAVAAVAAATTTPIRTPAGRRHSVLCARSHRTGAPHRDPPVPREFVLCVRDNAVLAI